MHGAVRITYPTSTLDARIRRYWLLLAGIAAVVLAAAALVGVAAGALRHPPAARARAGRGRGRRRRPRRARARARRPARGALARARLQRDGREARRCSCASQDEFVADASHELRTPLTALRLRLENGDAEGALPEVERLSDLVESLLVLARSDAGAAPAEQRRHRRPASATAPRRGGRSPTSATSGWPSRSRRAAPVRAGPTAARPGARQPRRERARPRAAAERPSPSRRTARRRGSSCACATRARG